MQRNWARRATCATRGAIRSFTAEHLEQRRLLSASVTVGVGDGDAEPGFQSRPAASGQLADEIVPGGVILRQLRPSLPLDLTAPPQPGRGPVNVGTFDIVLKKGPNLTANAAASAAFDAAAAFLESFISDPITVVVDAEIAPLGPNVIGSTGSIAYNGSYTSFRDLVVNGRAADEAIAASIPTAAQFTATVPNAPGNPYSIGGMSANRANLLALGVPTTSLTLGPSSAYDPSVEVDMDITFSSNFSFDYTRANGISAGQVDFVGVAIHELAHGLGFISEVDEVDFLQSNPAFGRVLRPSPMDLYRLAPGAGATNFTNAPRILAPGNIVANQVGYDGGIFDPAGIGSAGALTTGDVPFSTGVSNGDGRQASHWKDNALSGKQIGLMDPTAAGNGQQLNWLPPDTRMMGLIGWDIATVTATPGAPDLAAAVDLGASSSDNVTNRDNSTAAKNLQFTVTGTTAGATVTVYADGAAIGSATATGATTTVNTNGTTDLADGSHSITVRQSDPIKAVSNASSVLDVTIDTVGPTVDVTDVSPDPRLTGVSSVNVVFNEVINALPLGNVSLTRNGGAVALAVAQTPTTANNITFTVPNLLAATSTAGTYVLTVGAGGVTDVAGNALAAGANDTWVHALPAWLSGSASSLTWNSQTKALNVTGSATISANPGADLPLVTVTGASALLTISPGATAAVIQLGSLSLSGGADAIVTAFGAAPHVPGNRHTLVIQNPAGLSITGGGSKLDLLDNAAVLRNTSLSAAQALVTSGNNNGAWNGNGIVSGTAGANPAGPLAVGYVSGAQRPGAFQGVGTIGANDVMLRLTYDGDTDLDGLVNTDDILNILAGGKLDTPLAATWYEGDFTFDGLANTDDILEILAGGRLDA